MGNDIGFFMQLRLITWGASSPKEWIFTRENDDKMTIVAFNDIINIHVAIVIVFKQRESCKTKYIKRGRHGGSTVCYVNCSTIAWVTGSLTSGIVFHWIIFSTTAILPVANVCMSCFTLNFRLCRDVDSNPRTILQGSCTEFPSQWWLGIESPHDLDWGLRLSKRTSRKYTMGKMM